MNKVILKVILLGNSGVGKTALLNRYVDNTFSANSYKATIGSDFKTKQILIDEQNVVLQIWDTAGQERFQSLGDLFHRGANLCFLVFDITDKESFESIEQWKDEFLLSSNNENNENFPFALIANKVDMHKLRKVSQKRAVKWCNHKGNNNNNMFYFETSALDATNVAQAFQVMAKKALKIANEQKEKTKLYDSSKNIFLEKKVEEEKNKQPCCNQ